MVVRKELMLSCWRWDDGQKGNSDEAIKPSNMSRVLLVAPYFRLIS